MGFAVGHEVVVEGRDVGFAGAGCFCVLVFVGVVGGRGREVRGLESGDFLGEGERGGGGGGCWGGCVGYISTD